MTNNAVAATAIVMAGLFITAIAWQILAIARTAVARRNDTQAKQLHTRVQALEELHHDQHPSELHADQR